MDQDTAWTEVVGRKAKKVQSNKPEERTKVKVPKTQAVSIGYSKEGESYTSLMRRVTSAINLERLGVTVRGAHKAMSGAVIIEVLGSSDDADRLAEELRNTIGEFSQVKRPEKMTTVLLLDIQDWITLDDVKTALSELGGNVEGWTVTIHSNASGHGLRYVRVMLPVRDAEQLVEKRRIRVNWTSCRVKHLGNEGPRCFKCQKNGHMAAQCTGKERCYKCKEEGHVAKNCGAQAVETAALPQ